MRFYLHKYGVRPVKALKTFRSRRSLCAYMRKMDVSPSELADGYFLNVIAPNYSAIYHFASSDNVHLSAVLSSKELF